MAFYRESSDQPFTVIANQSLQDSNLSFEATGLLAFMLSLPADWKYSREWLTQQKKSIGRDKMKRILKELEENGYLVRKWRQDEKGKMEGQDWIIKPIKASDSKTLTEGLKTRPPVNTAVEKPATTNKTYKQNKQSISKPAEAVFDFDLVLTWVLVQFEKSGWFTLDSMDEAFVSAKLEEYQERYSRPNKGDALSYVEMAMRQRHGIELRSMKAGAARDKLNDSVTSQLEAQAAVIDQHTSNMKPKTFEEKINDYNWAEGLDS